MVEHGETLYEILGVDTSATDDEIERAYRGQVRRHHPDRPGGDPERMQRINKAKEILTNPLERRRYDRLGHAEYVDLERPAGWTETSRRTDATAEPATQTDESDRSDGDSASDTSTATGDHGLGDRSESTERRRRGATATTGDATADTGSSAASTAGTATADERETSDPQSPTDADTDENTDDTDDESTFEWAEDPERKADDERTSSESAAEESGDDDGSGERTATEAEPSTTGEAATTDRATDTGAETTASSSSSGSGTRTRSRSSESSRPSGRTARDASSASQSADRTRGASRSATTQSEQPSPTASDESRTAWISTAVSLLGTVLGLLATAGSRARSSASRLATALAESDHVPSRADVLAALRSTRLVEYLGTARPWSYAIPRTAGAVTAFVLLTTVFEVATGTAPGLFTLGLCLVLGAGIGTIRESTRLLYDTDGKRDSRQSTAGTPWSEDRLVQTSLAGGVGVVLFVLGFALVGQSILAASASLLVELAVVMLILGLGGGFAARTIDRSPVYGGLALGVAYVGPATLLLPPERWLLGGGLGDTAGALWLPMATLGPFQVGQAVNVLCAVAMVSTLLVPLLAFGGVFSTVLRRDVLDRGYTFQPLSWELGALGPILLGTALTLVPPTAGGAAMFRAAGETVLLFSLAVWPTVFLGWYALARLHHDGRIPDLPDEIASVRRG